MKARKMWARKGWADEFDPVRLYEVDQVPRGTFGPVLVTDATDMPDFEPGDRVRRALHGDMTGEVVGHPFQNAKSGSWRVPVYVCNEPNYRAWPCAECTKLPREKTVTLRVTGPDSAVDWFCQEGEQLTSIWKDGSYQTVRVERVEDPDA